MYRYILICILVRHILADELFYQDKSSWVDPGDGFSSDSNKKAILKGDQGNTEVKLYDVESSNELSVGSKTDSEGKQLKQAIELFNSSPEPEPNIQKYSWPHLFQLINSCKVNSEKIFINRLVQRMLREFSKWDTDSLEFKFYMSQDERQLLQDVVDHKRGISTVDDIILRLFNDISVPRSIFFFYNSPSDIIELLTTGWVLFVIICTISIVMLLWIKSLKLSLFQALFRVFVLLCFFSIFWEWIFLYKNAVAKQQRMLAKFTDIPSDCSIIDDSWWYYFFPKTDHCTQYYENMIDPVWTVTFVGAVTEVFSKVFSQPLGHIGRGVASFTYELRKVLPFYLYYPAIIISSIMGVSILYIILSLLLRVGFKIHFFGAGIETVNLNRPLQNHTVHQKIEELQHQIATITHQSITENQAKVKEKGSAKTFCNKSIQTELEILHLISNTESNDNLTSLAEKYRLCFNPTTREYFYLLPKKHNSSETLEPFMNLQKNQKPVLMLKQTENEVEVLTSNAVLSKFCDGKD